MFLKGCHRAALFFCRIPHWFWHNGIARLLDLPCPGCRSGDGKFDNCFCDDCCARFEWITGTICPGCGGERDGILNLCTKCVDIGNRPWSDARALFHFDGYVRELLLRLKNGDVVLAHAFAKLLADKLREFPDPPDVIVPVPLHFTRLITRGYNQSELLAQEVSRLTGIPVVHAIKRVKIVHKQALLGRNERLKNLVGAFALRKNIDFREKKVLLLDDVLTTGATLTAAAKALKKSRYQDLWILVVARR